MSPSKNRWSGSLYPTPSPNLNRETRFVEESPEFHLGPGPSEGGEFAMWAEPAPVSAASTHNATCL